MSGIPPDILGERVRGLRNIDAARFLQLFVQRETVAATAPPLLPIHSGESGESHGVLPTTAQDAPPAAAPVQDSPANVAAGVEAAIDEISSRAQEFLDSGLSFADNLLVLLLIPAMIFVYFHWRGLLLTIWYHTIFFFVTKVFLVEMQSTGEQSNVRWLLFLALCYATQLLVLVWSIDALNIRKVVLLLRLRTMELSFVEAFWIVITSDFTVRYFAQFCKVVVAMVSTDVKRRGRIFSSLEQTSLLLRSVITPLIWFAYFSQPTFPVVATSSFICAYVILKARRLAVAFRRCVGVWRSVLSTNPPIGKYVTIEECTESGTVCSICQDTPETPLELDCQHVYCEKCINSWFEKKPIPTCPLCRKEFPQPVALLRSDGSSALCCEFY